MAVINQLSIFGELEIDRFLQFVEYNKFNLFPHIEEFDKNKYIKNLIEQSSTEGSIFISYDKSEINAIITFKILEWDSNHFGIKCAILDNYFIKSNIDDKVQLNILNELLFEIKKDAVNKKVKFISISINSWDYIFSLVLQKNKFKYILTWIDGILNPSQKLTFTNKEPEIGIVEKSEIPKFMEIAENSYFKGGRFYLDNYFDRSQIRTMYSELVLNSFKNNDIMISYRIKNEPIGLMVCRKIETNTYLKNIRIAPLRFLVISSDVRTMNIGHDLFIGTINYLRGFCEIISTGFEAHNLQSMNLHSKLGFKFNYTHNVFHWRFKE